MCMCKAYMTTLMSAFRLFQLMPYTGLAETSKGVIITLNLKYSSCCNPHIYNINISFDIDMSCSNLFRLRSCGNKTIEIYIAMLDHFEITKLLKSIIHRWKGLLLRYIMVSVVLLYVN